MIIEFPSIVISTNKGAPKYTNLKNVPKYTNLKNAMIRTLYLLDIDSHIFKV